MISTVRITLFLLLTSFTVYAQWETVASLQGTHSDLVKAIVPRGTTLQYAVGNDVVLSSNQGDDWTVRHRHTMPNQVNGITRYHDVSLASENVGYVAYQNKIFKTTDGGGAWTSVLELTQTHAKYQASAYFSALHFTDDHHGFAVGDFKKIFKTSNGGATWETISRDNATTPFTSYTGVYFQDSHRGYVVGYQVDDIHMNFGFEPFILRTDDGGAHWDRYEIPSTGDYRKMSVQFVNDKTGFVHGTNSQSRDAIFVTHDAGETWSPCGPGGLQEIRCTYWLTETIGFASGDNDFYVGASYRTDDGGAHWELLDMPKGGTFPQGIINDIRFSDVAHGFAVGSGGHIAVTKDGGETWSSGNPFHPMYYALASDEEATLYATPGDGLHRSADGGASWQRAVSPGGMLAQSIQVTAPGEGYLYGYSNYLYRFAQDGTHFEELTLPVRFQYSHELIATSDSVYLAGATLVPMDKNMFVKTGDGGKTWTTYTIDDDALHTLVALYRHDNVFFAATTGAVFHSTNGGKSWKKLSDFGTNTITALCFLDKNIAVCATAAGDVRRSADGGVTWTDVTAPFPADNNTFRGFFAVDANTVYVFGSTNADNGVYGAIWKSDDRGISWKRESLPDRIDRTISAMTMDAEYLYATGGNSQVIRKVKSAGEIPTPLEPGAEERPLTLYPVPADETLMLALSGLVSDVSIQDAQGMRRPAVIEHAGDGLYRIALQDIAPGVYVLEVAQGDWLRRARFVKK
ncbi:YCF48-related protein [Parachryseolinea silvisoli]|uniref:YCF48-related protein n=1 Tax=Parachryseolinea silvisoli TaxID=2873601 RepID=UPI002265C8B0|nr:YCF48-related protein [Parachryseolinea silvisoli]MCD9014418.1 hypothetical protein [Parachryseolinea silvisoli]